MLKVLIFVVACMRASNLMAAYLTPISTEKSISEIHVNKDWTVRQRTEIINKVETEQGIAMLGEQNITYNSAPLMATSNSPTFGQSNSPRQDS
jgi:hypothetical protein